MTSANSIMPTALAALMALVLVGCSQEVPNLPASSGKPAQVAASAQIAHPELPVVERIPADAFTVVLSDVDCSETPVAVATVKWDAGTLAPGGISIFIESPQNPRKLWADAVQKDQATTGKWVFEGSRFTMQDRISGAALAQRIVDKIPCPRQ